MTPGRLVLLALLLPASVRLHAAPPGLTAGPNGTVLRQGQPYRGVGVNYFGCFHRTFYRPDDTSYDEGFQALAKYRIPFARFCAAGFWPSEMKLYQTDRAEYFRRLDGVIRSAEKHGVGLIPSLFWYYACVPDLVGEPMNAWGDRDSKTHAFMRQYTRDVVTRYKDSPAIWAWEFGNEFNLPCDLPNASKLRPRIVRTLGTAAARSDKDDLTHDMVVTALTAFGKEVRAIDRHRLISTGHSMPRPSSWHNRKESSWKKDSPEQFAEMLALAAPAPTDLVSVHCYGEQLESIGAAAAVARKLGRPLFVGEFQVANSTTEAGRKPFEETLRALETHRVPLAAVWVFDHRLQEAEFNITPTNRRAWQLDALRAWNSRAAGTPAPKRLPPE